MNRDGLDPCSRSEALARMEALAKIADAEYQLGTGDYHKDGFRKQYDCAGAAQCEAFKLTRHRKGFASGRVPVKYRDQSDVDDDINTNSALEDALTKQELYEVVLEGPVLPGDLVMYATLRIVGADGEKHVFIGHVGMFKFIPEGWTRVDGFYRCRILQCCGPNGRRPAVIETDGSAFDKHDRNWPKEQHRCQIIRVKQRVG